MSLASPPADRLAAPCAEEGRLAVPCAEEDAVVERPLEGESLLSAAERQGVPLPFGCRVGTCGSCAVEILEGAERLDAPDLLESDSLLRHAFPLRTRLACRTLGNGRVRLRPVP